MNDFLADFIALEVNVRSLGCPSDLKTFTFLMCLGRTGCAVVQIEITANLLLALLL